MLEPICFQFRTLATSRPAIYTNKAISDGALGIPCQTRLANLPESPDVTFLIPSDAQRYSSYCQSTNLCT